MFLPLSFLGIVETIYVQTTILASINVGRREWGKYSEPLSLRRCTGALWEIEFSVVLRCCRKTLNTDLWNKTS